MSECPYCQNTFEMTETCADEFTMWQGLVGPYYFPYIDENGVLTWSNTGDLPNPDPVNISGPPGKGLTIKGVVATVGDLPANPEEGDTYLVGATDPYDGYIWLNGTWVELGDISKGEAGEGVPTGGTTGQVLKKASNADYDTEWGIAGEPATSAPLMDGTAAVGTSTKYAREDHVHPVDTSRASASDVSSLTEEVGTFVRPNLLDNWYFVGGGSQQGGGQFPINQRGQTVYISSNEYTIDRWIKGDTESISVTSPGLVIDAGQWYSNIKQLLDPAITSYISGKTVTLSALVQVNSENCSTRLNLRDETAGTEVDHSFSLSSGTNLITYTATAPSFGNHSAAFYINGITNDQTKDLTVLAVKLELGTTQTLAHQENGTWVLNEIPEYFAELTKCKAYYQTINIDPIVFGYALAASSSLLRVTIPLSVAMRSTPNITTQGTILAVATGSVSSISFDRVDVFVGNLVGAFFTGSGFVSDGMYLLETWTDGKIVFSADL